MTATLSPEPAPPNAPRFQLFRRYSRGVLKERLVDCLGALAGLALTGFVSGYLLGQGAQLPLIIAPMGASAVLLFVVPSSPLAQPWDEDATAAYARNLLLRHNIRTLPVPTKEGRLWGIVGLRELIHPGDDFSRHIVRAATAANRDLALSLLPVLTDGRTYAVVIVDEEQKIIGLVSQTDLLSAIARTLPKEQPLKLAVA